MQRVHIACMDGRPPNDNSTLRRHKSENETRLTFINRTVDFLFVRLDICQEPDEFDLIMSDFDNLYSRLYLHGVHPLSTVTRQFISERMKSVVYRKGEIISAPGVLHTRLSIIKKGLVRGYYTINGEVITTWISIDDEIFCPVGFFSRSPSGESIEALETTFVEYFEHDDYAEALERFGDFLILNRILLEQYYAFAEKRALISRIPSASARLEYFLRNYNRDIISRCPKKYLASFLNMRPETLSRLIVEMKVAHV